MAGIDQFTKLCLQAKCLGGTLKDAETTEILDATGTHTITKAGTAQLSTAQKTMAGTASLLLDGDSDYLSIADNACFQFGGGTGDFTVEFYVRWVANSGTEQGIHGQTNVTSITTTITNGKIYFYSGVNFQIHADYSFSTGVWYHIAIVRQGTTNWYIFVDGVSKTVVLDAGATNFSLPNLAAAFEIGRYSGMYLNGYMQMFRLSDCARWTANYTPQTTRYITDANTKLLLNFEPQDRSGDFPGNTPKFTTFVGTAQLDTGTAKFSPGSYQLDGDSDYLSIPNNAANDWVLGTGNWTIDWWMNFNATTGPQDVWSIAYSNVLCRWKRDGSWSKMSILLNKANWYDYDFTPSTSTWYHLAAVRYNSTLAFAVNGTMSSFTSATQDLGVGTPSWDTNLWIGTGNLGTYFFGGFVSEFRLSKGIARWVTSFNPPNAHYYKTKPQVISG